MKVFVLDFPKVKDERGRRVFVVTSGVLISHILGGEIAFTHATVAIQQGSENWPLQI
ncbi:hypothetical protein JOD24_001631 [Kroppenstedtia sanguinis]